MTILVDLEIKFPKLFTKQKLKEERYKYASARFVEENKNVSMDSLADVNHPLINRLWPDRLDLGTMTVVLGNVSLPARILSGLDELETRLRAKARVLRSRLRG